MSYSLFISDLHLCANSPETTRLFLNFVQRTAPHAEALYILGDLFEYWAGDDDLNTPFQLEITGALQTLAKLGTRVFIMRGNRDFLNSAVNWLLDSSQLPEGIGPRPVEEFRLLISRQQKQQLNWLLLGALPGGVLFFGWLVWLVRRK